MTTGALLMTTSTRETLLSGYEDMRRGVMGQSDSPRRGLGLDLFIRNGMASWMQACASLGQPSVSRPPQAPWQSLPSALGVEVAMVLAQMALSTHTQGATT